MDDISSNIFALREASAKAIVHLSKPETILAIHENRVPKGNVFEMSKVAGFFAVKNTALNLPNSHPVSIEFTEIEYQIQHLEIHILVKVKSVCKSNLEMEAMHGATIVAMTMYDMLKPIDKGISIQQIQIDESPERLSKPENQIAIKAALVVCSNAIFKGIKPDSAGQEILAKLKGQKIHCTSYEVIPDDLQLIRDRAKSLASLNQLLIFSGGTGLSRTDITPEALEPLLERKIPGIEEAMRSYGQSRIPYAMFSRSMAGMIGDCMVIALPGSTRGARESLEAIFPHLFHVFKIMKGAKARTS